METRKCKVNLITEYDLERQEFKRQEMDATFHGWTQDVCPDDTGFFHRTMAIVETDDDGQVRVVEPTKVRFVRMVPKD